MEHRKKAKISLLVATPLLIIGVIFAVNFFLHDPLGIFLKSDAIVSSGNTAESTALIWRFRQAYFRSQTPLPTPTPTPTPRRSTATPTPKTTSTPKPVVQPTPTQTPAPASPAASPSISSSKPANSNEYGLSIGTTLLGLSDADLNKRLDDIAATGVGWVRLDIGWNDIQAKNSTTFDWYNNDKIIDGFAKRGIQVLAIIGYTPSWARPEGCSSIKCAPADNKAFAGFVGSAVDRYKSKVHVWEIWNEPNIVQFWQPAPDPLQYERLLAAAYTTIRSKDSSATVLSGSLSPAATQNGDIAPIDFLSELYQDGGKIFFDGVGFHPYSYPALPSYTQAWNAWSQMNDTNPSLRGIMSANGDSSKKIWLTEFGAPTNGPGITASVDDARLYQSPDHVTEDLQAKMVTDAARLAQGYSWAGPLFFFTYKDTGTASNSIENFFGLVRYDGSKKPAYDALEQVLAK